MKNLFDKQMLDIFRVCDNLLKIFKLMYFYWICFRKKKKRNIAQHLFVLISRVSSGERGGHKVLVLVIQDWT